MELTYEEGAPFKKFPWIRPTDLLKSMAKLNDLSHLLGGKQLHESAGLLRDFWQKYFVLHPEHQLRAKNLNLSRCIPCLIHGDEGTTYKQKWAFSPQPPGNDWNRDFEKRHGKKLQSYG